MTKTDVGNVLSKDHLLDAMRMHEDIQNGESIYEGTTSQFKDLCAPGGGSCATYDANNPICNCLVVSVLKMWNYDLETLEADTDVLGTLSKYGTKEDLEDVLGVATFDSSTGNLVSAEALSISYFLKDQSYVENGNLVDPVNEEWEGSVFLKTVQEGAFPTLTLAYLSTRSFSGEWS